MVKKSEFLLELQYIFQKMENKYVFLWFKVYDRGLNASTNDALSNETLIYGMFLMTPKVTGIRNFLKNILKNMFTEKKCLSSTPIAIFYVLSGSSSTSAFQNRWVFPIWIIFESCTFDNVKSWKSAIF